jgi:hypothetical protein
MTFRNGFYGGLVVAVIWGIYLVRLWQPQRQVELHSTHLLSRVENRKWKAVGEMVGPAYQDRWGNDRALLLERLPQVFGIMPNARIEWSDANFRTGDGRAYWTAKIAIKDTGEFADYVAGRVNTLDAPFEFEWVPGATWPWDWKLVSVRNPALEIPEFVR